MGVALVLVAACGPRAAQTRAANYERDVDKIVAETRGQLIKPSCRGDTTGWRECGLLADKWTGNDAFRAWAGENCTSMDSVETCSDRYLGAFARALALRYDKAVFAEVESVCATDPKCKFADYRELLMLESHNHHVFAEGTRRLKERDRQASDDDAAISEHQRQMQAIGDAIRRGGEGMSSAGRHVDTSYHPGGEVRAR